MFPWDDWPEKLKEAYQAVFKVLIDVVSTSVNFNDLAIVQWLFSNGYGLGTAIALLVALIMIPVGIGVKKHRGSAFYAAVIVVLGPVIGVLWFLAISVLNTFGDALTRGALFIGTLTTVDASGPTITLPSFTFGDPILNSAMFAGLFVWSLMLMMLFFSYEIINIALTLFGLITLYAYGLGPRTRRVMSMIISVLIVTLVIGRPIAIAIIQLGNWLGRVIPTNDLHWVGIITVICIFIALLVQITLPFLLYNGVSNVVGRMNGEVSGLVNSQPKGRQKVDATVTDKTTVRVNNRMRSIQSAQMNPSMKADITRAASATAASALTSAGVKVARTAALAGAKVHPATAVVSVAAPIIVKSAGNAVATRQQIRQKRVSRLNDHR